MSSSAPDEETVLAQEVSVSAVVSALSAMHQRELAVAPLQGHHQALARSRDPRPAQRAHSS